MVELIGTIVLGCLGIFVFGAIVEDVYWTYVEIIEEERASK